MMPGAAHVASSNASGDGYRALGWWPVACLTEAHKRSSFVMKLAYLEQRVPYLVDDLSSPPYARFGVAASSVIDRVRSCRSTRAPAVAISCSLIPPDHMTFAMSVAGRMTTVVSDSHGWRWAQIRSRCERPKRPSFASAHRIACDYRGADCRQRLTNDRLNGDRLIPSRISTWHGPLRPSADKSYTTGPVDRGTWSGNSVPL
jgi:hypothetical protein